MKTPPYCASFEIGRNVYGWIGGCWKRSLKVFKAVDSVWFYLARTLVLICLDSRQLLYGNVDCFDHYLLLAFRSTSDLLYAFSKITRSAACVGVVKISSC